MIGSTVNSKRQINGQIRGKKKRGEKRAEERIKWQKCDTRSYGNLVHTPTLRIPSPAHTQTHM